VVAYGDTKADSTTAVQAAKDIAIKYPDLKGFVCCDSTGASGAATALAELGLTGKVDVLGLDRNTDVLEMVKDGTITATLAQNDVSVAYWAFVCLFTENHANLPLSSDNAAAGAKVAPNYIYTSVNLITKDNVDYYLAANEVYATNGF
jgi:ribose transport system substrate-binding protein